MLKIILHSDRFITTICLVLICFLAWLYVLSGAGMGMTAWEMTNFSFTPYRHAGMQMYMPEMGMHLVPWSLQHSLLVLAMWWVMMIGMMLPSATPTILLYERVIQHAQKNMQSPRIVPTVYFVAGYLIIWLFFSVFATLIQWSLEQQDLLSMTLIANNRWLSGGLLITTGLYQLSPLKTACLNFCRAPAQFITDHMQLGKKGALKMGLRHGVFCLGCCWGLMLLLFVGGVMNLFWIVALSLLVLVEKLFPVPKKLAVIFNMALVLWGLVMLMI